LGRITRWSWSALTSSATPRTDPLIDTVID
jgi:hypothetical protein